MEGWDWKKKSQGQQSLQCLFAKCCLLHHWRGWWVHQQWPQCHKRQWRRVTTQQQKRKEDRAWWRWRWGNGTTKVKHSKQRKRRGLMAVFLCFWEELECFHLQNKGFEKEKRFVSQRLHKSGHKSKRCSFFPLFSLSATITTQPLTHTSVFPSTLQTTWCAPKTTTWQHRRKWWSTCTRWSTCSSTRMTSLLAQSPVKALDGCEWKGRAWLVQSIMMVLVFLDFVRKERKHCTPKQCHLLTTTIWNNESSYVTVLQAHIQSFHFLPTVSFSQPPFSGLDCGVPFFSKLRRVHDEEFGCKVNVFFTSFYYNYCCDGFSIYSLSQKMSDRLM